MPFKTTKLPLPDALLLESVKFEDSRGFFAEIYQSVSFKQFGISKEIKQINMSKSKKGVIRGLHYQLNPNPQGKIVRAVAGEIFDVIVDLRKNSDTFGKWYGVILNSSEVKMLYVPEGFAHGFEVLSESAEIEYLCSSIYSPENERGIIYNDADLNIKWSTKNPIVSDKDLKNLPFKNAEINF